MRTYRDKLVRDAIPELIRAAGNTCVTVTMDEPEYRRALRDKLVEEAREAAAAGPLDLVAELADLCEVIDAILDFHGIGRAALRAEQARRCAERGAFTQRLRPVVLHDRAAYYVWGHTLLARITPDGGSQYYHQDGVGSVRAVTSGQGDGQRGQVKAFANYEVFGELRSASGVEPHAVRYAGEWYDGESGLYHLRAWRYDPDTGRFTTPDHSPASGVRCAPWHSPRLSRGS